MRDLIVTTHTPVLRSGQMMRTYGIVRAISLHRGVDILYVRFDAPEPSAEFASIEGIAMHPVDPSRGLSRALTYARTRAAGVPHGFARGVSRELELRADVLAQSPERGRVIADGPIAAAALRHLSRRRAVIYNAHNLESELRPQLAEHDGRALRRLRAFERGLLARASESWMVSDRDIASARELCPGAQLRYVPNVLDVEAITPVHAPTGTRSALFVGSFAYTPNKNALHFLVEEVYPRVWAALPDAKLIVAGAGLQQTSFEDPRVQVLGFVDDLGAVYERSSCALVPLLQGGGSPLKFIEALAHGLPVIATPRATAGLSVTDGENCIVAEGAPAFAAALTAVLESGAAEVGRRGRELAESGYSIQTLSELLAAETDLSP
jgi:glycosyltransferase involved in cell wall biosynthesis